MAGEEGTDAREGGRQNARRDEAALELWRLPCKVAGSKRKRPSPRRLAIKEAQIK
jgi:hypothetical protein